MVKKSDPASTANCMRCGRPLPPDSRFCVSCGCYHASELLQTRAAAELELQHRRQRFGLLQRLFRFFRWGWWFSR